MLIDDDLRFEDGPGAPRPAAVVNRWLRLLPASGAPAPSSWENYARAVKEWTEFLAEHGVGLFDTRDRLKAGLSRYAEHRAAGPVRPRFAATTWGQHMSILSLFYRWAMDEGYAQAEPFTYRSARAVFAGTGREVRVNLAVRRTPKPHVTIKYLEPDFTELFRNGLRGLAPDGDRDTGFAGREMTRNAAVGGSGVGDRAAAAGVHALCWPCEIPALPPAPTAIPIPFPVPAGITKGRKFRTTWISYDALAGLHRLPAARPRRRQPTARPGGRRDGGVSRCMVSDPDARGGRINGVRRSWESLTPAERRRLVAPGGRVVPAGGEGRWWPVHRVGDGVRAHRRPDPGAVRAAVPACSSAPAAAHASRCGPWNIW